MSREALTGVLWSGHVMNLLVGRFSKLLSYRGRIDFDEDELSKVRGYKVTKVRRSKVKCAKVQMKVIEARIIKGYEFICSDYHVVKTPSSQ